MLYQPGSFAFIHIPRCGGMSIRTTILADSIHFPHLHSNSYSPAEQKFKRTRRHTTWRELAAIADDLSSIYTFCTIRNPFDFFESSYTQLCAWVKGLEKTGLAETVYPDQGIYETIRHKISKGFDQFVRGHLYIGDAGGLLKYWAGDINGRVSVDDVIKLEDLEDRWSSIYWKLGPLIPYDFTPPSSPPTLRTVNKLRRHAAQWDNELIRLVRAWCQYDFDHYYPDVEDPNT